jgi:NADH-quinone oxidoreductase subunit F
MAQMLRALVDGRESLDVGLLQDLGEVVTLTSICGLGQVVYNPIKSVLRWFRGDFDSYVHRN